MKTLRHQRKQLKKTLKDQKKDALCTWICRSDIVEMTILPKWSTDPMECPSKLQWHSSQNYKNSKIHEKAQKTKQPKQA